MKCEQCGKEINESEPSFEYCGMKVCGDCETDLNELDEADSIDDDWFPEDDVDEDIDINYQD